MERARPRGQREGGGGQTPSADRAESVPPTAAPRALSSIPESEPLLVKTRVQWDAPPSDSSSSASSSADEACLAEARPPDGGWGWVVVFASFMVNLIADGITFSFGVFYPHFVSYFGEGKGKTAWIAGIFMAMPLLSGPVASFLTDRYGCRRVTVAGALLAAFGFVVSAFVDNIETLFITFGIMAGFGLSLCYVAAVVIVAYYFDKKRSLATGISVCGSGIGTFIFAPLTYSLLDEYGWRGTTLILAGFFLNMAACGLLFRDLPWTATMNEERARERRRKRDRKRHHRRAPPPPSAADTISEGGSAVGEDGDGGPCAAADPPPPARYSSLVDLPTFMTRGEGVSLEVFEMMSSRGRAYALLAQNYPGSMLPSRSFSDSGRLHDLSPPPRPLPAPPPARKLVDPAAGADKAAVALWLRRTPPAPAPVTGGARRPVAFLADVRVHRHSLTYRGAMLNINRYRLRASSCPNIFRNSMTTIAKEKAVWYSGLWELWDLGVEILDLSHFRNPAFLVFAVSNFLLYMWYDVPYIYISDSGMGMGFSEPDASMLIGIIGILNMLGEIVLGWVGDWACTRPTALYAACMLLCGGATALMPLASTYWELAASAGAFGAFIAANYSLTSIILVEQITLEKFTNAYGLLLLIQGMANLGGPSLAGWICDVTGSYDLSFYLAGLFIGVSGVVLGATPLCRRPRLPAPPPPPPGAPQPGDKLAEIKLMM